MQIISLGRLMFYLLTLLLISGGLLAHGEQSDAFSQLTPDQTTLKIVATTSIVADPILSIAGSMIDTGEIEISTLIPTGVDPHDFEPTPSDITEINGSDFIFWLGGGAEESLEELLEFWEENDKSLALIEAIPEQQLILGNPEEHEGETEEEHEEHDDHGLYDPHFWMDPLLWSTSISAMIDTLLTLVPEANQEEIISSGNEYLSNLESLHTNIISAVDVLDSSQRFLVTQHSSLAYYGRQYNFTMKSLQGISTDSEAGIQEIDALATYLVDNEIEVVFTESTTTPENIEAVLEAARAQGHSVVVGGQLFVASLGDGISSYVEMMEYNTDTIVGAILNPPEPTAQPLPLEWTGVGLAVLLPTLRRRRRNE